MAFKIGNINIEHNIVLAPMAGISNPSYMKIIEEMGAGLAFTELISAEAIIRNNKKTFDMLNGIEKLKIPVGIQIFGADANTMAKAAKILIDKYNIKLIDINMGCPVPKVAIRSQAGSALLKNPNKVYEVVKSVVDAISIPVTVKIRSGWDENNINAVSIAKVCEQAGAKAISIHARTRSQGYSGKANWQIIKEVKEAVNIPVIGNGDITSCYKAEEMLNLTGCDAIMIGRGVLGNPWLIKECREYLEEGKYPQIISFNDKIDMMKKHYQLLLEDKNEKVALLEIRSHIMWYLKGMPNNKEMKNSICKCQNSRDILACLDKYAEKIEKNI